MKTLIIIDDESDASTILLGLIARHFPDYHISVEATRNSEDTPTLQQFPINKDNLPYSIPEKRQQKIILSTAEGLHIVLLNELIRLQSDGSYTTFFTPRERIVVSQSIGDFEALIETGPFFRVHQSHIINLQFVHKVLREDGGYALMQDGQQIPLARRRKEEFIKVLTGRN